MIPSVTTILAVASLALVSWKRARTGGEDWSCRGCPCRRWERTLYNYGDISAASGIHLFPALP